MDYIMGTTPDGYFYIARDTKINRWGSSTDISALLSGFLLTTIAYSLCAAGAILSLLPLALVSGLCALVLSGIVWFFGIRCHSLFWNSATIFVVPPPRWNELAFLTRNNAGIRNYFARAALDYAADPQIDSARITEDVEHLLSLSVMPVSV